MEIVLKIIRKNEVWIFFENAEFAGTTVLISEEAKPLILHELYIYKLCKSAQI